MYKSKNRELKIIRLNPKLTSLKLEIEYKKFVQISKNKHKFNRNITFVD